MEWTGFHTLRAGAHKKVLRRWYTTVIRHFDSTAIRLSFDVESQSNRSRIITHKRAAASILERYAFGSRLKRPQQGSSLCLCRLLTNRQTDRQTDRQTAVVVVVVVVVCVTVCVCMCVVPCRWQFVTRRQRDDPVDV